MNIENVYRKISNKTLKLLSKEKKKIYKRGHCFTLKIKGIRRSAGCDIQHIRILNK